MSGDIPELDEVLLDQVSESGEGAGEDMSYRYDSCAHSPVMRVEQDLGERHHLRGAVPAVRAVHEHGVPLLQLVRHELARLQDLPGLR